MNHRERINAVLRGQPTDKVPVALWRHFPNDDLSAEGLAARTVEFQRAFDFDLVKVTPASGYPAEMYGAVFTDGRNREGTRDYVRRPVVSLDDWGKIAPLGAANPVFVRELAALELVRSGVGHDVPVLQTVFSPLNAARNLAGDRLMEDLRAAPEILHGALAALTETTVLFALESLRAGADAIFFATQMATSSLMTREEFRTFGEPYDRQVLEAIRHAGADFTLLHIHGLDVYFDLLTRYPVEAVNWHDRRTPPSLKDVGCTFGGTLVGGLDEWDILAAGSPGEVLEQGRDAVARTRGRGFILAAGCVIPVDTPEENIRAAVAAARG
jgi:uroporphyrinogen decarboxylase